MLFRKELQSTRPFSGLSLGFQRYYPFHKTVELLDTNGKNARVPIRKNVNSKSEEVEVVDQNLSFFSRRLLLGGVAS